MLQLALQKTVLSFTKFQDKAIKSNSLAPALALDLSRAAMEVACHAQAVHSIGNGRHSGKDSSPDSSTSTSLTRKRIPAGSENVIPDTETEDILAGVSNVAANRNDTNTAAARSSPLQLRSSIHSPSTFSFPWTASQHHLTFTQRFRLACVERGVQLLSDPNITLSTLHPIFSLHLRSMAIEDMRYLAERNLFQKLITDPYGPQSTTALEHPSVFRTVEGNSGVFVGRPYQREVESLRFGCTRTVVETWLPGFEGEWLEPIDVKEYLESKRVATQNGGEIMGGARAATHDLYRAIEYLALRAVCIGLGPAVRKADVDRALDICLV